MRLTDIDWPEIILDLRRTGMRQQEIAEHAQGVSESMIRQYLAGASPAHWRGEVLLKLWEAHTGKGREAAPRRPVETRRIAERRPKPKPAALMPTEHLPAVARAYGLSIPALLQLLHQSEK